MAIWRPDPTFYPSPRMATKAPPEALAYVVRLNPHGNGKPDAMCVVDVDPQSSTFGKVVGATEMPYTGGELHHFGWNACSSMLCPNAPHPHVERRYLVVPDIRSSHITILDIKENPTQPQVVKVIEPGELFERTGYARPHTVHCGPDGIYISALGNPEGEGPGGIFILDHDTFEVLGRWEIDRADQYLHYDFWWHLGYDTLITSEWGTPRMVGMACSAKSCWPANMVIASTFGICTGVAIYKRLTSAQNTRWRWSCVRRITRRKPTAFSTAWSASKTSQPRSGCGTGTMVRGRYKR